MNIYKVSQKTNMDSETFQSFIAIAEDENEVRKMHPRNDNIVYTLDGWCWKNENALKPDITLSHEWVYVNYIDQLTVDFIGVANLNSKKGVIMVSYQ